MSLNVSKITITITISVTICYSLCFFESFICCFGSELPFLPFVAIGSMAKISFR